MSDPFRAWVLRASAVGFTAGCRLLLRDVPQFGNLVKVTASSKLDLFGLIYGIRVRDDPIVRQLILAEVIEPDVAQLQLEYRLVPIEIDVLHVGYQPEREIIQGLPPQPPLSLDQFQVCDEAGLRAFTSRLDYLSLILRAGQSPIDELFVAHLHQAAAVRAPEARYHFLVDAGRELTRLIGLDLGRLDHLLRRLRPAAK